MGYWGWRSFLFAFVSVWIVSCTPNSPSSNLPPTEYPPVTLIAENARPSPPQTSTHTPITTFVSASEAAAPVYTYALQPEDTPASIARRFNIPIDHLMTANQWKFPDSTALQYLTIPNPIRIPDSPSLLLNSIRLEAPACYYTFEDSLVCMGEVENVGDDPVGGPGIRLILWDGQGSSVVVQTTVLQRLILPGHSAPYGAVIGGVAVDPLVVTASLSFVTPPPDQIVPLQFHRERYTSIQSQHGVVAELLHEYSFSVQALQGFLTLYDSEDRLVGYRIHEFSAILPAGTTHKIEISAVVQFDREVASYRLAAEGKIIGE